MSSNSKIVQAAIKAREDGYKYMASVVKSVYSTTYYHVVPIDEIIAAGRWIKATVIQHPRGWHGRVGIPYLPPDTIRKDEAIRKYCK